MDMDELKGWHAVLAAVISGALVLVGRASATRKGIRKDTAEGDLFSNLSTALDRSEQRRKEESEAYRQREADHERRHLENMEKMLTLSTTVARLEGKLEGMQMQYTETMKALERSTQTNSRLAQELSEHRTFAIQRLGMILPPSPPHEGNPR